MFVWINRLDHHFPIRYSVGALRGRPRRRRPPGTGWASSPGSRSPSRLVLLGVRDVRQSRHSILRNYPVIGHLRFLFEFIRPEMRQYFIESDNEAAPFSRQQRSLVYQRAKGDSDKRPFGTQLDVARGGYEWINHSLQPTRWRRTTSACDRRRPCAQPYSASIFNISAMSFGSLSANAILRAQQAAPRGRLRARHRRRLDHRPTTACMAAT